MSGEKEIVAKIQKNGNGMHRVVRTKSHTNGMKSTSVMEVKNGAYNWIWNDSDSATLFRHIGEALEAYRDARVADKWEDVINLDYVRFEENDGEKEAEDYV